MNTLTDFAMNSHDIVHFAADLDRYLQERFGYKRPPCFVRYPTIDARRKRFNLYLRWNPENATYGGAALVIARMGFLRTRSGHGTSLLRFISDRQPRYGYEFVGLEMTNEESDAFARALRFRPVRSPTRMPDGTLSDVLPSHWMIDADALRQTLVCRESEPNSLS